uniref:PH domain-containing protein n=1 Tax=Macrostomum lignano TaxID=282301 RepID=A0A1I8FK77_9PLAT
QLERNSYLHWFTAVLQRLRPTALATTDCPFVIAILSNGWPPKSSRARARCTNGADIPERFGMNREQKHTHPDVLKGELDLATYTPMFGLARLLPGQIRNSTWPATPTAWPASNGLRQPVESADSVIDDRSCSPAWPRCRPKAEEPPGSGCETDDEAVRVWTRPGILRMSLDKLCRERPASPSCQHAVLAVLFIALPEPEQPKAYEPAASSPKRRLLFDSKSRLPMASKSLRGSSSTVYLLFDDASLCSVTAWPLAVLWLDVQDAQSSSGSSEAKLVLLKTPEDTLKLYFASWEDKTTWITNLYRAINTVVNSNVLSQRRSTALTVGPPEQRYGVYTFKAGSFKDCTYSGYWMSGLMEGQGRLVFPNRSFFIGHFARKQDARPSNGAGVLGNDKSEASASATAADAASGPAAVEALEEIREGAWRDNVQVRPRLSPLRQRDEYFGNFLDGQRDGFGHFQQFLAGRLACTYIGEWRRDVRHGYGVEYSERTGQHYSGYWANNLRHGCGVLLSLDGAYKRGGFDRGELTGPGLVVRGHCGGGDSPLLYDGELTAARPQGKGVRAVRRRTGSDWRLLWRLRRIEVQWYRQAEGPKRRRCWRRGGESAFAKSPNARLQAAATRAFI